MTLGNTNTGKAGTNTQAADASDATQNAQSTQSHIKSVESLDKGNDMERGLKNRHVQFIAIGEMMYSDPSQHTFINFITRYLGRGWGKFAGWTY